MSLAVENENPDIEELNEIDSLQSDNEEEANEFSDSDDEFVPPPPPEEAYTSENFTSKENETDGEDEDDINSLVSETENIQLNELPNNNMYMNAMIGHEDEDEDDDEDEDEDEDENYLQKFENLNKKNLISTFHPELVTHNNDEVETFTHITRNEQGVIIDPLHKTLPFITKYEKARILGERAKQLNQGAKPLIEIGPDVIDGYLIALREFDEKKIPFIIKRPMPNGGCEYWKFKDLEVI